MIYKLIARLLLPIIKEIEILRIIEFQEEYGRNGERYKNINDNTCNSTERFERTQGHQY